MIPFAFPFASSRHSEYAQVVALRRIASPTTHWLTPGVK